MFGLEIEFSSIHDVSPSINTFDGIDVVYYSHPLFTIGSDAPNFETRSSILYDVNHAKTIVETMKRLGCHVDEDHDCGIHVHIDRGDHRKTKIRRSLRKFLQKNYDDILLEFEPLRSRQQHYKYRDGYDPNAMIYIHGKYNTLEFRLFDSKLDTAYVMRCIKRSKQWAREILSNAN